MKRIDLSSFDRPSLEHLLKMMKHYRNGLKQIGKRTTLTDPKEPKKERAIVELHSGLSEADGLRYADSVIRYAFPKYTWESPLVRINDGLKGGARVFVGDDMVDVTLQKFENLLK